MKEISKKNKKLVIVLISIVIVLFICFSLVISHYIEKGLQAMEPGITLNMIPDDVEYKQYDVEDMSDEEINKYLELIRDKEDSADE